MTGAARRVWQTTGLGLRGPAALLTLALLALAACQPAPSPTATPSPAPTATPVPPTATPTPVAEGLRQAAAARADRALPAYAERLAIYDKLDRAQSFTRPDEGRQLQRDIEQSRGRLNEARAELSAAQEGFRRVAAEQTPAWAMPHGDKRAQAAAARLENVKAAEDLTGQVGPVLKVLPDLLGVEDQLRSLNGDLNALTDLLPARKFDEARRKVHAQRQAIGDAKGQFALAYTPTRLATLEQLVEVYTECERALDLADQLVTASERNDLAGTVRNASDLRAQGDKIERMARAVDRQALFAWLGNGLRLSRERDATNETRARQLDQEAAALLGR